MVRFIVFIFMLCAPLSAFSEDFGCFKYINVKITKLYPNIKFPDDIGRYSFIVVRHKVDCETKEIIIPSNYEQAVDFLDFSLPLDYKSASVSASLNLEEVGFSLYSNSNYGYSVDEDLIDHFHDIWLLDENDNVCKNKFGEYYPVEENNNHEFIEIGCFWLLKEQLIKSYQQGFRGLDKK